MDTIGEKMKLITLGIVSIFWFCSFNIYAATECNTKLTKEDRYDELNKTLQCLSLKLHELEQWKTKQKDILLSNVVEESVTPSLSRKKNYSDDNFQVTLKSCTKNRKNIYCVLIYKNISNMNVGIGFLGNTTYLVDDNGERWDYKSNTAIVNGHRRTEIPQQTHLITKVTFVAQGNTEGKKFSLFIKHNLEKGEFKIAFNDVLLN